MEKFIDENGVLDIKAYCAWLEEHKGDDSCVVQNKIPCEVKKVNEETFEFIASTDSVDRAGEAIEVEGWDTKAYNKTNGVVLADHVNKIKNIIGSGKAKKTDGKLVLRVKFATDVEENELARFAKSMVEKGYLNTVSVGFRPLAWKIEERKHDNGEKRDTLIFTKQELLEVSLVAVPANKEAVRKGIASGALKGKEAEMAEKIISKLTPKQKADDEQEKLLVVLRESHGVTKKYRKSFEQIRKLLGVEPEENESETIEKAMEKLIVILADFKPAEKKVPVIPKSTDAKARPANVDPQKLGESLQKCICC